MVLTVEQLKERTIADLPFKVRRVLVDYHKIKVVALVASRSGLLGRSWTIPLESVNIRENQIVIDAAWLTAGNKNGAANKKVFGDAARFGEIEERAVYTERKRHLGKLVTYKLDCETGLITALWVKPPLALRDIWRQILLISRSQIVCVTPEAIIVDDAIVRSALKPATAADLGVGEPEVALG